MSQAQAAVGSMRASGSRVKLNGMTRTGFNEQVGADLERLYITGDALRRRVWVRSHLRATEGERILDVGCGPGFFCAEVADEVSPSGCVVGVDRSPAMLALAAERCAGRTNVEFRPGDTASLPVEESSFDAALCVQVLEYVPDYSLALAEIYRALLPGGRVVIWDIDWATVSWHSEMPRRMERVLESWDGHLVHPSLPRVLGPAMRTVGFESVRMHPYSFAAAEFTNDSYGVSLIPLITKFVARRGLAEDVEAWASEQRELGRRDEFYFSVLQMCFTASKPGRSQRSR